MGLEWGDMYKRTDALVLTRSEDIVYHLSTPTPYSSSPYNIKEDLFERDEEFFQGMTRKDFQDGFVYPTYTPSRQPGSSFPLNLPSIDEDNDGEIYFPSYDDVECSDKVECVEPAAETMSVAQRPVSPHPIERPEDDSAIRVQPSRHVDYLSHDWTEEDVWASWKHIVSKRGAYNNSARLENASWRSWAKKRSNLMTVPPETVKWMKDHDLTWLYGPLMPGPCAFGESCTSNNKGRRISKAEIARHSKKPILKKRSLSEIMLRRSISSSLLLKQAVVAKLGKDTTRTSFPFESPPLPRSNTGMFSPRSTSGLETLERWKKVQFHELVEQCIVLANAGDDEHEYHYCSDSDDDVIVMRKAKKRATSKWLPAIKPKKQAAISKTIEKLPHATLKYTEELEDVLGDEIIEEFSCSESASSFSQDIPDQIILDHDRDEENDMDWQPPAWLQGRKDSVQIVKDRLSGFKMQQEEATLEATQQHRPQLERRDAVKEEQNIPHVPMALTREGSDASIKFELPPCRSQLAAFSFNPAPKYQSPRNDYFMVDPGMTEGDSDSSVDMSRSSSQSKESSEKSNSPGLDLDNFQRTVVDQVMGEFWVLFKQQWDTSLSQSTVSPPLSPTGPTTSLSERKRRRGDKRSPRSREQRRGNDKSNDFETIPEEVPPSPDSKELRDYESYIHRELPRLVYRSIEDAIRRDSQPTEAHLIGNLVSIIHDCQEKAFQSYIETTGRNGITKGLGIMSIDPSQTSHVSEDPDSEHHHSELLDAAFQQPPSQYIGNYRSSIRSSTLSLTSKSPSLAPTTPSDMVFLDSRHTSRVASTMTSPNPSRRGTDTNKYSLPGNGMGKDAMPVREWDIYDELDEAVSWSRVY